MAYNEEVTMMMSVVPGAMTGISTMMSGLVSINNVFMDMTRQLDASFGLIDTSIITASTIVAQLGLSAAEAFGQFEQGLKVAQMVSGQTAQDMDYLRQKANEFSVSYRADIDQITEGLQTLGRAGLNSAAEQTEVLENGLSTAKLEGRDLNGVLEELIQNTALLGGNLKSSDFGESSKYVNDLLVATSMTAPITTHDVSETLKYSGGIAAAAGADINSEDGKRILEDYMGAIAAFAQKGVTGSIAGTALRAFFNKPATQDSSVTDALASIHLKPEYLWEDDEETMKPISEQIGIIKKQMEDLNVSTMDQLQIWSKIVGGKMGQQMMKLDSSSIKELTKDIQSANDAESLASGTFETYQMKMKEMTEQGQVAFREFGEKVAWFLNPIITLLTKFLELLSNPVVSGGLFVGALALISNAKDKFMNVFKSLRAEFSVIMDYFKRGDELYSVRPSTIRKAGRGYSGRDRERLYTKYGGVGIGAKNEYDYLAEQKWMKDNNLSPEDLGALNRLNKENSMDKYNLVSIRELAKLRRFEGSQFTSALGLPQGWKMNDYNVAKYAMEHGLWEKEDTKFLLDPKNPHSTEDFARERGVSLYSRVKKHLSEASLANIDEGFELKDAKSIQKMNSILDNVFGIYEGTTEEARTRYYNALATVQGFFREEYGGEVVTLKPHDIKTLYHRLNSIANVDVSPDFLVKNSDIYGPKVNHDVSNRYRRKGETGRADSQKAKEDRLYERKLQEWEKKRTNVFLDKLQRLGIVDEEVISNEFDNLFEYFKDESESRPNKILREMNLPRDMIYQLIKSNNFGEFIESIPYNLNDDENKYNAIYRRASTAAKQWDQGDNFQELKNYAVKTIGGYNPVLEEAFLENFKLERDISKYQKKIEDSTKYAIGYKDTDYGHPMTLRDLRTAVENIDPEGNARIKAYNQSKLGKPKEYSKLASKKYVFQEFQDYFNKISIQSEHFQSEFKEKLINDFGDLVLPVEEALYFMKEAPSFDYVKSLKLDNGKTLYTTLKEKYGPEKTYEILTSLTNGYSQMLGRLGEAFDFTVTRDLYDLENNTQSWFGVGVEADYDTSSFNQLGQTQLRIIGNALGVNKRLKSPDKIKAAIQDKLGYGITPEILSNLDLTAFDEIENTNDKRRLMGALMQLLSLENQGKHLNRNSSKKDISERLTNAKESPEIYSQGGGQYYEESKKLQKEKEELEERIRRAEEERQKAEKEADEKKRKEWEKKIEEDKKKLEENKKQLEEILEDMGGEFVSDYEAQQAAIKEEKERLKPKREDYTRGKDEVFLYKDQPFVKHMSQLYENKKTLEDQVQKIDKEFEEEWESRRKQFGEAKTNAKSRREANILKRKQQEFEKRSKKRSINPYEGLSMLPGLIYGGYEDYEGPEGEISGTDDVYAKRGTYSYGYKKPESKSLRDRLHLPSLGIKDAISSHLFAPRPNRLIGSADSTKKLTNALGNITDLAGGPLLIAIQGATMAIEYIKGLYEDYSKDTKELANAVKGAYSDISSAESGLRRAYKEQNPDATNEDTENYMLDVYDQMYKDFQTGDWLNKAEIKEDKTLKDYEYDEEKDDGSYKEKEEEEKTPEETYEEAVKENTGALYSAMAQLQTSTNALVTKMQDGMWGVDGFSSQISDALGEMQDTALYLTEGSGFVKEGNFLLTASQKDSNYQGYTEMAGLMLEDFHDAKGDLSSGLKTMLGKDSTDVLSTMNSGGTKLLQNLADFSAGKEKNSLTRYQNLALQQSMKNNKKMWQSVGKEMAKVELKKKSGKQVTKSDMRRLNSYIKRLATETGLSKVQIKQAAQLQQLQDMYSVAQQSMVPLAQQQADIAAQHLVTGKITQGDVSGSGAGAKGTQQVASIIASMVSVIAQAKAGEAYYQQQIAAGDPEALKAGSAEEYIKKGITEKTSYKDLINNITFGQGADLISNVAGGLARNFGGSEDNVRAGVDKLLKSTAYKSQGNKDIFTGWLTTLETMGEMSRNPDWTQEQAEANAKRKLAPYFDKDGNPLYNEDVLLKIARENYADAITPALLKQYMGSDIGEVKDDGEGSGSGSGSGSGNKGDNQGTRKERVDLVLCSKKEIPKLNVNLFKKPPTFTVLNKNFKVRDVKINTEDTPKAIMSAIKNSFIDVQKRSDPKIIQDEEGVYNPEQSTEGNPLPSGSAKTRTD